MDMFLARSWEGNVREMENTIVQGILFSTSDEIKPQDVTFSENQKTNSLPDSAYQDMLYKAAKEQTLKKFNHDYLGSLLKTNQGNVTRTARQCGLERQALQQIMRRYKIKADVYRK
jgi:DNA-binding NtrC family response regulator